VTDPTRSGRCHWCRKVADLNRYGSCERCWHRDSDYNGEKHLVPEPAHTRVIAGTAWDTTARTDGEPPKRRAHPGEPKFDPQAGTALLADVPPWRRRFIMQTGQDWRDGPWRWPVERREDYDIDYYAPLERAPRSVQRQRFNLTRGGALRPWQIVRDETTVRRLGDRDQKTLRQIRRVRRLRPLGAALKKDRSLSYVAHLRCLVCLQPLHLLERKQVRYDQACDACDKAWRREGYPLGNTFVRFQMERRVSCRKQMIAAGTPEHLAALDRAVEYLEFVRPPLAKIMPLSRVKYNSVIHSWDNCMSGKQLSDAVSLAAQ
jgi:hypothetical protein